MFLDIATNQKVDSKGFMCLPHIFSSLFFEIPSHSLHLKLKKKKILCIECIKFYKNYNTLFKRANFRWDYYFLTQ